MKSLFFGLGFSIASIFTVQNWKRITLGLIKHFSGAVSYFNSRSIISRITWITLSALGGIYLTLAIPFRLPLSLPRMHSLEIIATGEMNPSSKGSEVWVFNFRSDRKQIPLTSLLLNGGWEMRDGALLSYQNQPASISWRGILTDPVKITFLNHPWSGLVKVRLDSNEQVIDLYAQDGKAKEYILSGLNKKPPSMAQNVLITGGFLGFILFLTTVWIASRPHTTKDVKPVHGWESILYASVMIAVWGYFLLIFWPGMMSSDTTSQILAALRGEYNDTHPVLHTFIIGGLFRITGSSGVIAIVQILALALTAGYGLYRLQKTGVPRYITWIACAFFALSPVNSTMVISIWKDIPFSFAILWLSIFLFEISITQGEWLNSIRNTALFFVVLLLIPFFRHNGIIVPLGVLAFGWILFYRQRRRLASLLVLFLLAVVFIRGPVFSVLGVQKSGPFFSSLYELFHIAAHLQAGTPFSASEIDLLNKIRPVKDNWSYSCYAIGYIILAPDFNFDAAYQNSKEIQKIFLSKLLANPAVNLRHMICSSSLVWEVENSAAPFNTFFLFKKDEVNWEGDWETIAPKPNPYGWKLESRLPSRLEPTAVYLYNTMQPDFVWFIWRPAFYLYLMIFGAVRQSLRSKNMFPFLVISPALFVCLSIFLVNGSQDFRYIYPVYLVFSFIWPYLFFGNPESPGINTEQEASINNNAILKPEMDVQSSFVQK